MAIKSVILYTGTILAVLLGIIAGGYFRAEAASPGGSTGIVTAFLLGLGAAAIVNHPRVALGLFIATGGIALIGAASLGGLWVYVAIAIVMAWGAYTMIRHPQPTMARQEPAPYTGG